VGQEDLGSPSHQVSPRPPRARGNRARPGCLAVGKGERCRGVSSCRGPQVGVPQRSSGVWGHTVPAPRHSPVPLVLALQIHPGDGGDEKGDGEAEQKLWGEAAAPLLRWWGAMQRCPSPSPRNTPHPCCTALPSHPSPLRGRGHRGLPKRKRTEAVRLLPASRCVPAAAPLCDYLG